MADTERTLAALQALLADNTEGAISPQDLRDLLVSVFPKRTQVSTSDASVTVPALGAYEDYTLILTSVGQVVQLSAGNVAGSRLRIKTTDGAGSNQVLPQAGAKFDGASSYYVGQWQELLLECVSDTLWIICSLYGA